MSPSLKQILQWWILILDQMFYKKNVFESKTFFNPKICRLQCHNVWRNYFWTSVLLLLLLLSCHARDCKSVWQLFIASIDCISHFSQESAYENDLNSCQILLFDLVFRVIFYAKQILARLRNAQCYYSKPSKMIVTLCPIQFSLGNQSIWISSPLS